MKKLVLGSLALAALASQTIGCTTSDDPEFATIRATWGFQDLKPNSMPDIETGCPISSTRVSVTMHNQEIDLDGRPIGPEILDVFDCDTFAGFTDPLDTTVYDSFLSVSDGIGVIATTPVRELDVIDRDVSYDETILNNGGYFQFSWKLMAGGVPATCAQAPDVDGVGIVSTYASDTSIFVDDKFDCELGFVRTPGLYFGLYNVAIDAIDRNTGGPASNTVTFNQREIKTDNGVRDLGDVVLNLL